MGSTPPEIERIDTKHDHVFITRRFGTHQTSKVSLFWGPNPAVSKLGGDPTNGDPTNKARVMQTYSWKLLELCWR